MMLNKAHFQNVEEFFGAEWLQEGCRQLQDDIGHMIEEGMDRNCTGIPGSPDPCALVQANLGQHASKRLRLEVERAMLTLDRYQGHAGLLELLAGWERYS